MKRTPGRSDPSTSKKKKGGRADRGRRGNHGGPVGIPGIPEIHVGEFAISQNGYPDPVGWVYASEDLPQVYWAFVDGEFQFADVGSANWIMILDYISSTKYASFSDWRDHVCEDYAQGRDVFFEKDEILFFGGRRCPVTKRAKRGRSRK